MNGRTLLPGLLCLALSSAAVAAEPATACVPVLEKPWVRAAPPGARMLAGYVVVRNPCAAPVVVSGVESKDFADAMIHRTVVEGGVSRMRAAGRLVVAPGAELRFEPGGLHLMLMRPLRELPEGARAGVRLLLADGRKLYAEYDLRREAP
jgi:hypothetical protein